MIIKREITSLDANFFLIMCKYARQGAGEFFSDFSMKIVRLSRHEAPIIIQEIVVMTEDQRRK